MSTYVEIPADLSLCQNDQFNMGGYRGRQYVKPQEESRLNESSHEEAENKGIYRKYVVKNEENNRSSDRQNQSDGGWDLRSRQSRAPFYQRDNDMDLYEPNPLWDDDFNSANSDIKKPFELGRII